METFGYGSTQEFMEAYHRLETDPFELVSGFGVDWLELLMEHNEGREEYELCAEIKKVLDKKPRKTRKKKTEVL